MTTKSSIDRLNASSAGRDDARQDQREGHLPERLQLVRAEVHRRLLEVAREARQARPDGDDHEADVEHDVGDQDRDEVQREERVGCRSTTNSVSSEAPRTISGRRHRQEDQRVREPSPAEVVAHEGEGDQRAQDGRDERRQRPRSRGSGRRPAAGPSTPSGLSQYLRVNPCHTVLALPAGLLKLNRMISATGSSR